MAIESTTRISGDAEDNEGNSSSTKPDFSPDGTKVALVSQASNLVPGDTNNLQNNLDVDASPPPETWSITPQDVRVNENAGTVTFTVSRSNPTAAETVYVSTLDNLENEGATNEGDYVGKFYEPLTFAAGSTVATVTVEILDDGFIESDETFRLLVQQFREDLDTFLTSTTFTIADNDPGNPPAIESITRISTALDGTQGNYSSYSEVFSPDGSRIAFTSGASNLVPGDTNNASDIFLKNLGTGAIERLSTAADGTQGNDGSYRPVLSPDGSRIAFYSYASNLVPSDTNNVDDIFVKDLGTGAIAIVSADADGVPGDSRSSDLVFSPDGSKIAFQSGASNLVPGDTNNAGDIFVKDLTTEAIERVSTAADGTQGNDGSYRPVLSPDGSRIAFTSYASNLVPSDTNGVEDVFVKDLGSGAIARVSTAADGMQGNNSSSGPVFSPDGSRIAFNSVASNLVPGGTDNDDIFVKDLGTGAIARVSTAADGTQGNDVSIYPMFSPDGGRIAFTSYASNFVPGDTNGIDDIFVKDLGTGAIAIVSADAYGVPGDSISQNAVSSSQNAVFSPDGGKIAFWSDASNLIRGDTNRTYDVFVKDLGTGAIERISTAADGTQGNRGSFEPVFSPDGSGIAFTSYASNLVPGDTNDAGDIFVAALENTPPPPVITWSIAPQSVSVGEGAGTAEFTVSRSGSTAAQTVYLSTVENEGATNEDDYVGKLNEPVVFAAGEQSKTVSVTIIDDATVAEPEETFGLIVQSAPGNPPTEILAAATFTIEDNDPGNPAIKSITRISTAADGTQGNENSADPAFSPDGGRIAFTSGASNLAPGDTNDTTDIFVKDLGTGAIERISTAADGTQSNNDSGSPVFSPDGSRIAFASYASNLVPGDTNDRFDIFVKDLATGAIERISTAADGMQSNSESFDPVFSPDGRKIAFYSYASNLVPNDTNNASDILVKDLDTGAIERISTAADGMQGSGGTYDSNSYGPVFSPDGRKIAFYSFASNLVPGDTNNEGDIFVKDLGTGAIERISTTADGTQSNSRSFLPVFSPDGGRIAFASYASNLVPGDTNNAGDIFVKDLATGAIALVSTAADGTQGNNYSSSRPAFSPDGRRIAFDSEASNLVPGDDINDWEDVFVKDLDTGAIARLSTAIDGTQSDWFSFGAVFSPDGSRIAFISEATTLVPGDTNNLSDIFMVELDDAWVSPPVVTWSIAPQSVSVGEDAGTAEFMLSRSGSTAAQTVYLSTVENEGATNEGAYVGKLNEPVVFAAGEQSKTVSVTIIDDATVAEPDETFGLIVQAAPDDPSTELLASATFTIEDNDPLKPVEPIVGTRRNDKLIGTDGNDIIQGLAGHDRLEGKESNDVLLGGPDHDRLDGGDGDDILIGGKGIDKLTGGRGVDLFVIDALSKIPDTIVDFTPSQGDRLSLGPLIDSLDLRTEPDIDDLVGATRVWKSIAVTLDTNGVDPRGGVKVVALLFRPEITDPQQILESVDTDTLVSDHGDYWG